MVAPSSTYRLQIRAGFDLDAAARTTAYLRELGVGAVYTSPLLQSAAGSDHGYDVVDVTRIDPARGGSAGWASLVESARAQGLGLVVDIVPNHVGVADASENAAWWDVLRLGPASPYAHWFDIDWRYGRVRLPVLGDDVDLTRELTIDGDELRYHEHRFPIAPGTGPAPGEGPAEVHARQRYELVNFRVADTDQNYRRFFAVTTLAGLRVEDPAVFDATHAEIARWVREDAIDGLRVDHPDGLADPSTYLERLRALAGDAWIIVEKILEPGERLPAAWPVAGTTGYDALAEVGRVLVDPAAVPALDDLYVQLTGDELSFTDHVEAGKRHVATTILRAEINRLANLVPEVSDAAAALTELVVAFPVYRSYLPLGAEHLAEATELAQARRPDLKSAIGALESRLHDPGDELCVRFQQATGAVMAKGVEDTAYYRYSRFVAANEVGGDPARPGTSVEAFHAAQVQRQQDAPRGMTTLSTHDTKRGEDVRAWLSTLAEVPREWGALAERLMTAAPVPNLSFGYLLWQTLVGVGFIERARMHAYAEKAMREAAAGTQWVDPNGQFEAAMHAAVDTAYDSPDLRSAVEEFRTALRPAAWSNALSQKLVQLTMPGIPDVYQGTERWEDSLVDPDNRRPVDLTADAEALADLDRLGRPPAVATDGLAKLWVASRALRARRDRPELFTGYRAVHATGPHAGHVLAFDRGGAITVATRLPIRLAGAGGWADTTLDLPRAAVDALTGRTFGTTVRLAELLAGYPVALLLAV